MLLLIGSGARPSQWHDRDVKAESQWCNEISVWLVILQTVLQTYDCHSAYDYSL